MAAAIESDPITHQTRLTKDFEAHAANYHNWSVDSTILDSFPDVAGLIRIVQQTDGVMEG